MLVVTKGLCVEVDVASTGEEEVSIAGTFGLGVVNPCRSIVVLSIGWCFPRSTLPGGGGGVSDGRRVVVVVVVEEEEASVYGKKKCIVKKQKKKLVAKITQV